MNAFDELLAASKRNQRSKTDTLKKTKKKEEKTLELKKPVSVKKLEPLPAPLKARVIEYKDFGKVPKPSTPPPQEKKPRVKIAKEDISIDQWFYLNNSSGLHFQWVSHQYQILKYIPSLENQLFGIFDDTEDDLVGLLAVMDHLEKFTFSDESNTSSDEPPAKKSSKNIDFRWKSTVKLQNAGATLRNFTEQVQEKEVFYISVCTNSFSGCDSVLSMLIDENLKIAPSILKSILQKNVRRCRPWPAVRTALTLIRIDFAHFIRRLSIIMLEDAILHPALPFVVWLMMANSHQFQPSIELINILLQITWEISAIEYCDYLPAGVMGVPCQNIFSFEELDTMLSNQPSCYCLVRCLLARAAYGGMNCDQNMLHYYSTTWANRFLLKSRPPEIVEEPNYLPYLHIHSEMNDWEKYLHTIYAKVHNPEVSIKTVSAMVPDDIPLAAIDFHCTSILDDILNNKTVATMDKIKQILQVEHIDFNTLAATMKSIMWRKRSSINIKKSISVNKGGYRPEEDNWEALWKFYEPHFDNYSRIKIIGLIK